MDIVDVLALDKWVKAWVPPALGHYQPLAAVLQNNSQPQAAQPVEPPLEALIGFLKEMPTVELSSQQLGVLEALGVSHLLGRQGAYWVKRTVRTATYDPATTNNKIQEAVIALQGSEKKMNSFVTSATALGFEFGNEDLEDDLFRVSVCFRDKVSIDTMKWSCFSGQVCGSAKMHPD